MLTSVFIDALNKLVNYSRTTHLQDLTILLINYYVNMVLEIIELTHEQFNSTYFVPTST